jgi:hypothetical protein
MCSAGRRNSLGQGPGFGIVSSSEASFARQGHLRGLDKAWNSVDTDQLAAKEFFVRYKTVRTEPLVESGPYGVSGMGEVPYSDVAGTCNAEDGGNSWLILNRDRTQAHEVKVNWGGQQIPARVMAALVMSGKDGKASINSWAAQNVAPAEFPNLRSRGTVLGSKCPGNPILCCSGREAVAAENDWG